MEKIGKMHAHTWNLISKNAKEEFAKLLIYEILSFIDSINFCSLIFTGCLTYTDSWLSSRKLPLLTLK